MNDNGRSVSIGVDEQFAVRLASNPTTGYRWHLVASDTGIVEALGEAVFVRDVAPGGAVGVGGVDVWQFRGARAGHQVLSFVYRRPWEESSPPAQTVTYSITVR